MYEVTKSVYYREKRNFEKGKVEDGENGVVSSIETPDCSDENVELLIQQVLDFHNVKLVDVVLSKLSVKVIESSVVVKLYEMEDGSSATTDNIADWHAGVIDLYLGCYKHDIQKVERANVDLTMYGEME